MNGLCGVYEQVCPKNLKYGEKFKIYCYSCQKVKLILHTFTTNRVKYLKSLFLLLLMIMANEVQKSEVGAQALYTLTFFYIHYLTRNNRIIQYIFLKHISNLQISKRKK